MEGCGSDDECDNEMNGMNAMMNERGEWRIDWRIDWMLFGFACPARITDEGAAVAVCHRVWSVAPIRLILFIR